MTVSPCEFPPRGLITCVLSTISKNYNIFFLVLSPLIKSSYKTKNCKFCEFCEFLQDDFLFIALLTGDRKECILLMWRAT